MRSAGRKNSTHCVPRISVCAQKSGAKRCSRRKSAAQCAPCRIEQQIRGSNAPLLHRSQRQDQRGQPQSHQQLAQGAVLGNNRLVSRENGINSSSFAPTRSSAGIAHGSRGAKTQLRPTCKRRHGQDTRQRHGQSQVNAQRKQRAAGCTPAGVPSMRQVGQQCGKAAWKALRQSRSTQPYFSSP